MANKKQIDLKKVEALASRGLTFEQVADNLDISRQTFFNRRKEEPEIEEAFQRGRSKGIRAVANALWEKAQTGDNTAMIFYLKCNGWKESQEIEITNNSPIQLIIKNDLKD